MTTLFVGGVAYCPSARRFFERLLELKVPFLYLPFNEQQIGVKKQYWQSLSACLPAGAPSTFPAVILLSEEMQPKQWTENSRWMTDEAILRYLHSNPPSSAFLKTATCTDRFETITENTQAWQRFHQNTAFIFVRPV
jgi:hypothetical protein